MKTKKMILLGYGDGIKGYRLLDPETEGVVHSRDVVFLKEENGHETIKSEQEEDSPGQVVVDVGDEQSEDVSE